MKNTKTAWVVFKRIISFLFIIFMILYFQAETGENKTLRNKTIITQKNIEKFEEDIKNGKNIDIKNYTEENDIDTSNFISDTGYIISEKTSKFVGKYLVDFFKFVGKLIK